MTFNEAETRRCRYCGDDVVVTRVDEQFQQTDGYGLIVCDDCSGTREPYWES